MRWFCFRCRARPDLPCDKTSSSHRRPRPRRRTLRRVSVDDRDLLFRAPSLVPASGAPSPLAVTCRVLAQE